MAARLRWLSTVAGLDLVRLGTTADADEIRDTAVTQPLLVATALAAAAELELPDGAADVVTAGHSVGELAAAALAGVLRPGGGRRAGPAARPGDGRRLRARRDRHVRGARRRPGRGRRRHRGATA